MLRIVLIALAFGLTAPAGAAAFDTGPHGDLTVDALRAEGFSPDAADVGRINNWFVDMYSNAGSYPYSGHADATKVLLGGALGNSENWSNAVVKSASALHFDSGVPNAETTAGLEAEWQRLRGAVYNMVQGAKARRNPLDLLMTIGASLHAVQDFYSHTNFAEPQGTGIFEAPGWVTRNEGLTPTWFDVPKSVRDGARIYAGAAKGIVREHGGFKSDPAKSMAKDDPGRPNFQNGYISAYFGSRQWIEAIRSWLNDDALWGAAINWKQRISELDYDVSGAIGMSTYSGHLYGAGEPWAPGNSDKRGWGGSLVALRSVVQSYFEDRGRTIYRRTFERLIPQMAVQPMPAVSDAQAAIASSRPLQAATRFVRLQIVYMRGIDLGDPGPDDGDMYSRATIDGQRYVSPVIQAHDRFSFGKPYYPFTFIKSVPKGASRDEPIREMTVEIRTSSSRFSGTDDDMYLRISPQKRFLLDKLVYDDFERGDRDTYSVPIDAAARAGLKMGDLQYAQIEKSRDGVAGGYKLGGVTLRVNGRTVVANNGIERWLEKNHRTWRAPGFVGAARFGPAVPVWFDLREDDLRIYGGDDQGDVNPFDARDAIVRGYVPGPGAVDEAPTTGGRRHGGRLTKGGDK
ncbi:MAG TPA: PLAT/LH2 domain-containing protein, partial [Solirubrobacterales bacterium]|nr:PLAT/LH2 domain-containing protein [Solirubrobacterales bacterium]